MKNELELFLITYNRKEKCRQTLQALLADNSPVKALPLTILDNCSTDGTGEMLAEFAAQHPHIRLIRHPKNIGGNANIARAFEMAHAAYVWVLCDDDKLDFSAWPACEQLLAQRPAAVVVADYAHPQKGPAYLLRQLTFVPAAIYRTDLITSTVLINMYFNVSDMFPQLAVAAAALNSGQAVRILPKPLVTMQLSPGNDSYVRGSNAAEHVHPLMKEMFWSLGYLRSIQLLCDKKIRTACACLANTEGDCFYNFCGRFLSHGKNPFYLYAEGIHLMPSWGQKLLFALLAPLAWVCSFDCNEEEINIRIFGKIKTRIWKFSKSKTGWKF